MSLLHFLGLAHHERGKSLRLIKEQIRCADLILLNKTDQLTTEYINEVKNMLEKLNHHVKIIETVRCEIDMGLMFNSIHRESEHYDQNEQQYPSIEKTNEHFQHHTHNHVMTYTHRFNGVVDREKFEKLFSIMPAEVYRAKGVVKFAQDQEYYLFQFAYREIEIVKINSQQSVEPVAVFIGEYFDKNQVQRSIQELTNINRFEIRLQLFL